jgi:hypothetical protein
MKNTHELLDIVPANAGIVLVGLNPTKEAIEQKAVFCNSNAFWNVLVKSGLLHSSILKVPKKQRAIEAFQNQGYSHTTVGFADLLPLESETDSKKVKIPLNVAHNFIHNSQNIRTAEKLVLMGQKVANAFAKQYGLTKWENLPIVDGVKQFGSIGTIAMDGQKIEIIAVPFPVNNSIKDKPAIYKNAIGLN